MIRCSRMSATNASTFEASTRAPENRASPATWAERVLDAGRVVVRHHDVLEEAAPRRDGDRRRADTAGTDDEDAHVQSTS